MTRPVKNLTGFVATGDAIHFGSNDLDQVNLLFTGQDQSSTDPITTNTQWTATKVTLDTELNTIANNQALARYTVYRNVAGTYKYKDWKNGTIVSNTNSLDDMLNNSLLPAITAGGYINILCGDGLSSTFILKNPILLPMATGAGIPIKMMGSFSSGKRNTSVTFQADPTFPANRFMIEGLGIPATGTAGMSPNLQVSDIFFYNPNFSTFNMGGISLEYDSGLTYDNCRIENCMFQYMYQGLKLAGFSYYARLNRLNFDDASSSFLGDYDIKLYQGTAGHLDHPPKIAHISYITSHHTDAFMNNSLWMEAAYSLVTDYFIDGYGFKEAAFGLHGEGDGCHDNEFIRLMTFDTSAIPSPDNRKATIYLNGANCNGNKFLFAHPNAAPYMVMFDNGAFRNTVRTMYWGNPVNIKDDAAGTRNIVVVEEGSQATAGVNTKITSTAGNVKIVDERVGARGRGLSAQQSGNGTTTVFNIPHGCFATPAYIMVQPASVSALGNFSMSATSTNIVVTYQVAPPSGTNNLQWYWNAEVYS